MNRPTLETLSVRLFELHAQLREAVEQTGIVWARHAERHAEHARAFQQCACERDEWRRRAEAAEARLAIEGGVPDIEPEEVRAERRALQAIDAGLVELANGIFKLAEGE